MSRSVSSESRDTACSGASPSNLTSLKPSGIPNGLGALTTARVAPAPDEASSRSSATPKAWRECNSWASSTTKSVRGPSAAAAMAEVEDGESTLSHIPPIAAASVSALHDAHRTVQPLARASSAAARARHDLPIPGKPLRRMLEPPSKEEEIAMVSSSLPCRATGSGSGPKQRPLRAAGGAPYSERASRPDTVM
uniref:Uncharacterized protein n=1 Tax=uncultured marine group II/III euryarchaeote AD1000_80_H11 TaxID=1457814 RepID=A0A075G463_9EURY|nr:hypothetical protein [uncultured marine group II/III euryarchaeote AD1000_80_H11]